MEQVTSYLINYKCGIWTFIAIVMLRVLNLDDRWAVSFSGSNVIFFFDFWIQCEKNWMQMYFFGEIHKKMRFYMTLITIFFYNCLQCYEWFYFWLMLYFIRCSAIVGTFLLFYWYFLHSIDICFWISIIFPLHNHKIYF